MARRSVRLENAGYYDVDGSPRISYSTGTRRHSFPQDQVRPPQVRVSEPVQRPEPVHRSEPVQRSEQTRSWRWFNWFSWGLLLKLLFSLTSLVVSQVNLRSLRMELHHLQQDLGRLQTMAHPQATLWGNFALASHGAQVLTAFSSSTHQQKGSPSWLTPYSPWEVIKGQYYPLVPGHCWAFSGQTGELFVALSQKIHVSHITVGHISKEQSVTGEILSAPKAFALYGLEEVDGPKVHLGTFQYESDGDSFQTFEIKEHTSNIFRFVKLEVLTNHGLEDYTCLYSFRVHGKIPEAATTL
uniref:SUN domain-containing protein n=1 Tax=Knipowitschia caucasica TaxID=637954 RepID=A0AAV2L8E5_KNICA